MAALRDAPGLIGIISRVEQNLVIPSNCRQDGIPPYTYRSLAGIEIKEQGGKAIGDQYHATESTEVRSLRRK